MPVTFCDGRLFGALPKHFRKNLAGDRGRGVSATDAVFNTDGERNLWPVIGREPHKPGAVDSLPFAGAEVVILRRARFPGDTQPLDGGGMSRPVRILHGAEHGMAYDFNLLGFCG